MSSPPSGNPQAGRGRGNQEQEAGASSSSTAVGESAPIGPIGTPSAVPDASASPGGISSLAAGLEATSLAMPVPPANKRGSGGPTVSLSTNFIQLGCSETFGIYEYQVSFDPPVDEHRAKFGLLRQHRDAIGQNQTFDGSKLILPHELPKPTTILVSKLPDDKGDVNIQITFKAKCNTSDNAVLVLLNSIIKRVFGALDLAFLRRGLQRGYYDPLNKNVLEKHRLEIWPGYVVAAEDYDGGLLLMCDSSSRVMRTDTVLDVIASSAKRAPGSYRDDARKMLLGSSCITRYNNKSYKIDEIDFDLSPSSTFTDDHGRMHKFTDYYLTKYGVEVKDLDQPLLVSHVKSTPGSEETKTVLLVPELCFLCGMTEAQRQDFKCMKDVSEFTRLPPARKEKIVQNLINSINSNKEAMQHFSNWGLSISEKSLKLEGRQLPSPPLLFGQGYKESVQKGDWSRAATSRHVLAGVPLDRWVVVYPEREERAARTFFDTLSQQASRMGLRVATPRCVKLPKDTIEHYLAAIRNAGAECQIVVSLFGGPQRADRYAAVKKLHYIDLGLPSQVVMLKTLGNEKRLLSVVQKIALQINCKLGGELWGCQIPISGLMCIGIDVYRDKGGAKSIAAIVASMNGMYSKYFSTVVFEKAGRSFAEELTEGIKLAVAKYLEANGGKVSKIVIWRDGVNAGQMFTATREGNMMASGIKSLFSDGQEPPEISIVVVQKKISARYYSYFPNNPGVFENPPAGTVIDHTTTLRMSYDFYLIPMAVSQGTVTPVHYVVVYDSSTMKPETLQKLSYALGHGYFNWPGHVRVPCVCQYAHKLVEMVGEHLHRDTNKSLSNTLFYL